MMGEFTGAMARRTADRTIARAYARKQFRTVPTGTPYPAGLIQGGQIVHIADLEQNLDWPSYPHTEPRDGPVKCRWCARRAVSA